MMAPPCLQYRQESRAGRPARLHEIPWSLVGIVLQRQGDLRWFPYRPLIRAPGAPDKPEPAIRVFVILERNSR